MSDRQRAFLDWLDRQELTRTPLYDCPYLPNRQAVQYGFASDKLDAELYQALMDRGFRRSGTIFYGMECPSCNACVPLRIPVTTFRPSKSQRRTLRKNSDIQVKFAEPQFRDESHALYQRYLRHQHPATPQDESKESFEEILYGKAVDGIEARYFLGEDLVGVSLLDIGTQSLSAVYHFFEPSARDRRIGVLSVLMEIEHARMLDIPYYYLGYWVKDAATMGYKASYGPNEVLVSGEWVSLPTKQTPDGQNS